MDDKPSASPFSRKKSSIQKLLQPFLVTSSSGQHFSALDGVRGLAVLMVLLYHTWLAAYSPRYSLAHLGIRLDLSHLIAVCFTGVDLFFILSGFLLSQLWIRADLRGGPKPNLKNYFRRRWYRIAPGYYCALVLWVILFIPTITPASLFYSGRGLLAFGVQAALLNNLLPVSAQYNPTWWTISVESLFYLILPLFVILFLRNRVLFGLLISIIISALWAALLLHPPAALTEIISNASQALLRGIVPPEKLREFPMSILDNQLPSYCIAFALGVALANLYLTDRHSRLRRLLTSPHAGTVYFITGCAVVLIALDRYGHAIVRHQHVSLIAVTTIVSFGFSLLMAGVLFGKSWTRSCFDFTPLRLLGLVGYSAYLWHIPVIFFLSRLPHIRALRATTRFPALFLEALVVTVFLACFFFVTVEKPFLVRSKKRSDPKKKFDQTIAGVNW